MRIFLLLILSIYIIQVGYAQTLISPLTLCELDEELNETSGLVNINGEIWTHNDSGGTDRLYQINPETGEIIRDVKILDGDNDDWEDLAADDNYVYIGDFGNNYGDRTDLKIYRISKTDISLYDEVEAEKIEFSYSDQTSWEPNHNNHNFDCEAMICYLGNLYLFSKNWVDHKTRLYVLPKEPGTYTAQYLETFDANCLVTGAEILEGSNTLILTGYSSNGGTSTWMFNDFIGDNFFNGESTLFYWTVLSQLEGVCFDQDNSVYFSSEEFENVVEPKLYSFDFEEYITSIQNMDYSSVEISVSGYTISISSPNNPISGQMTLYNILGQNILEKDLRAETNIDVTVDAPQGLYIVSIKLKDQRILKKIRI
jgi:hypothetical protein